MVEGTGLTDNEVEHFLKEGVLCIPDFLTPEETQSLLSRAHEILRDFDMDTHPKTQFKTGNNNHVGDQYFFDSSDKISYFFDVDAFDEVGNLKYPKEQAINKIGHGLHMRDDLFRRITLDPKIKSIAHSLDFKDPRVLQSMCIFKHPVNDKSSQRENAVPPHTDGTFLFTKPQSAVGFWFALEDCTKENGCLSYNPGSHRTFPITKRFVKVNEGKDGCNFVDVEYDTSTDLPEDKEEDYKVVECKAGSLILIHNSVLHKSENNVSNKSRFAYTFHVIDGTTEYDKLNWLQVPPSEKGGTNFTKLYEETL